ncbi:symmetrical bis(5'-nucleosyl)-tetraphosphatase [Achromobacter sp. F4_2707]|uniref:symmetrical bis(5'-nucleosyl)-tetraphosphatase n=1 Tax=Achromobacter sp. F4_2707 TaxID=3114286 RepID=UPI0039C5F21B
MTTHPPIWMIGDLQGCNDALQRLLDHPDIAADRNARFWFAGDLVNRGPDSLKTLRTIMSLGDRATCVLGNHDFHLLAIAAGFKKPGKSDTFDEILAAPDAEGILDWVRHRPLLHREHNHIMVHAGILPPWSATQAQELAREVETAMRGPRWATALEKIYGNEPNYWDKNLENGKRLRVIVNAMTRMRMCTPDGRMDFSHKHAPDSKGGLVPWFDVPGRVIEDETIVFGHWSTLGLMIRPDAICLDTGCVWGRQLTALRLHDHKLVQVNCHPFRAPATQG